MPSIQANVPTNVRTRGKAVHTFLSVAYDGPKIDCWSSDDASGRQRWVFEPASSGKFKIKLVESERSGWYLKNVGGGKVTLAEGAMGATLWEAMSLRDGGWSIRATGESSPLSYLSVHSDTWDAAVDLYSKVTSNGRQTWFVEKVAPTPTPTPVPDPTPTPSPAGALLKIDQALQLPGWGASSKRTRLAFDRESIRVNYPAHPHASSGGTNWSFNPTVARLPAREARVSFDVYFPEDFPFEAQGSSAGKIGSGFHVGPGDASGGNWSNSGASFRMMWLGAESWGSYAMAYVYMEVADPANFRGTIDQKPGVLEGAGTVLTNGGANIFRNIAEPCKFYKGKWNSCSMYMKLNTPGRYDGAIEMQVNGLKHRIDDFRWVIPGSRSNIEKFLMTSWFGGSGSDPAWAPGRACYSLTKNVRVWSA